MSDQLSGLVRQSLYVAEECLSRSSENEGRDRHSSANHRSFHIGCSMLRFLATVDITKKTDWLLQLFSITKTFLETKLHFLKL